jgi:ribose transport system permease protein
MPDAQITPREGPEAMDALESKTTAAAPGARQEDAAEPARGGRSVPELAGLLVVLVVLIVFFALKSPYFLGTDNILNILTAIAVTGIIAVPGTMLLVAGQVDLSVGSGAAFCGVLLATRVDSLGLAASVLLVIVAGIAIGAVNGFLVNVVNVNSLITTLGMLAVLRGLTQLMADGQTAIITGFSGLGTARPLGVPLPVIIFALVVLAGVFLTRFTVFGRSLYAIGANPVAARLVGIRTRWTLFITFVLSGLAVAVAGLILTSQLSAASPVAANGLELTVVTAVVLGGASLAGGRGTVLGTVLGLVIIGVLNNGLTLLNINSFWQDVARGLLLILAVSFDQLRLRLSPTG